MMQTQNGAERAFEDEVGGFFEIFGTLNTNKAGYTATEVACGLAGAIFEVTRPFGQEQWGQKIKS